MNRRDALARVGLLIGGTVVGAEAFLTGCTPKRSENSPAHSFEDATVAFLDEVGETILPTSASSPGAKAAMVGAFMKIMVTDCYEEKDQQIFLDGIKKINDAAELKFGNPFMDIDAKQRHELLVVIDSEAKTYARDKTNDQPTHYFTMLKQLTLWGYFTSEVGSKQALRFNPIPGRYEGCIDYKKGDRAWAAI